MFDGLLIHPATRQMLEALRKNPPHALLLVGVQGVGKLTVAKAWARHIAQVDEGVQVISPDEKGTMSIDVIRSLYQSTRSKSARRDVVVIDHAEALGTEAQNAFLKLLEEPRPGLTFILTAPHTDVLLPTVVSRTQPVQVRTLDDTSLKAYATQHLKDVDISQLLFIASGRPGVLMAGQPAWQRAFDAVKQAKELLAAKPYQRFAAVSTLAADRAQLVNVLESMLRITALQLAKSQPAAQTKQWLARSSAIETALMQLSRNANAKAQLLKLFASY